MGMSSISFWTFRCSLNLSANVLADSPMYSSSHSTLSHLYLYMTLLFFRIGSLSFGDIRRFLMVNPQYSVKGGWKPHEKYQRSFIYKGQQSIPKHKHRQIPSATHMGWGSVKQLRTEIEVNNWPSGYSICHLWS